MTDKYKYIVDTSQDFITLINREYIYEVVNNAYEKSINKKKDEVLHKTVAHVWGQDIFDTKLKGYLDRCFEGEEVHYIETFKFGLENRYMHVSLYPYREFDDGITHTLVFSHDITKLGKIESKLINYEYRDPLTGLFNQKSLDIILEMELEKAKRSKHENLRAVLFIDIMNLKEVNQRYGHELGNILLENTGLRVKECIRDSDFVFSFRGSELVVILTHLSHKIDAARVAEKIYDSVAYPYQFKKYSIKLHAAIGISIYPNDGDAVSSLVEDAISAASEAESHKKPYMLFDAVLYKEARARIDIEAELGAAFHRKEYRLFFQPIVDREGQIRGAEALIRWLHPVKGLVSPIDFIPVAEDSGLIEEIGKWVIFETTRHLSKWTKIWDIYISLNLCAKEFGNEELVEIVENALLQADDLDPRYLKLEITESEGIEDRDNFFEKINRLKALGIEVYIDDFGTGQSSLEYLKNIPADVLKVDKIFVDEVDREQEDRDFLESMITLIKTRKKRIIVEGLSRKSQVDILMQMDCDLFQGYFFSRPVPAEEFQELLVSGTRLPQ